VPDFLTFASESAELLWKTAEDQLGPAVSAARAGHLGDHDAKAESIKDAIALHLVRSHRYLRMHHTIVEQSIEFVRQDAPRSRTAMLAAEFQRRHRLLPAGPEGLAAVLDEPIAKWRALDGRGVTVRVSMEAMFQRVRAALRAQAVEVWHAPRGHELLISDTPAFTSVTSARTRPSSCTSPSVTLTASPCRSRGTAWRSSARPPKMTT